METIQKGNRPAALGVIFIIPALILVFGGILQSFFGAPQFNESINFDLFIFHPVIILGGLALAFGLNLLSVARVKFEQGALIGAVQIKGKLLSLGLMTVVGLMVAIIFVYLLAENFQIFARW